MKVIALWFLIAISNNKSTPITWSPPMTTLQECQRVFAAVRSTLERQSDYRPAFQCVQVNTIVKE